MGSVRLHGLTIMQTSEFTHLHVHSDASRIDGLGRVQRLVAAAASMGYTGLGLTDHGTLANAISFSQACAQHGLRPTLGMEAYVGRDGKRYHLTLLADGTKGFHTLVRLNNIGQTGEDQTRPTFDIAELRRHNDGVILLTGCPASPFQDSEWADAKALVGELKPHFDGRMFAEAMFVSTSGPWERSARLAKDLKLPVVVTNDVHFPYATDANSHHILTQLKAAFTYESRLLYLATPSQLATRVADMAPDYLGMLSVGMRNAHRLASKLEVVTFDAKPKLPHIDRADETLVEQASASLSRKFGDDTSSDKYQRYKHRMDDELGVIKDLGVAGYFLILADIISWSKSRGIRVGPGRGSGAGSLVVYLLDMTEIDPIEYDLSFDRFLNRKRAELPDIDTDFESERRQEVIDYAKTRWGALPVATYSRYMHKLLVHDLSRLFHVDRALDDAAADEGPDGEAFGKLASLHPDMIKTYDAMSGQIRHIGQHAGGVVIVEDAEVVPLERTSAGDPVVGWTEGEYRELTLAGIIKFDLLGLTALSVLNRLEHAIGTRAPAPVDGSPVFELFKSGDLTGIFQFAGSDGIIRFTKRVQPDTFEDLVAINAMYRPGALDSGAAEKFPEWRKSPRTVDPLIDDILRPTYGVICYQEQMMAIYRVVTGGDEADADLARKVFSKARPGQPDWEEKMAKLRATFFKGAKSHGWSDELAREVFSELLTHTRYSFNRSHAVAYTRISWDLAWFKYHHPVHFYAQQLNVDVANWQRLLFEAIARGIVVKPPHLNTSTREFEVKGDTIYLPLNVIKHLGTNGVQAILTSRPFTDASSFMSTVPAKSVNARARRGLYMMGAFDGIEGASPKTLKFDADKEVIKDPATEFIGFPLPTVEQLKRVDMATRAGYVAGVVAKSENRTSKHGPYRVYQLLPSGAVWERSGPTLEVGQWVRLKTDATNGRIRSAQPL